MRTILASMFLIAAVAHGQQLDAETYYVAPKGAATVATPDGSIAKPFKSVVDALYGGKVKGGDTVLLMDGYHGSLLLYKIAFDSPVKIISQNGKQAHFDWIAIRGASSNLTFERITVWPSSMSGIPSSNLIGTHVETSRIVFKDMDIRSDPNAADYLSWDAAKWDARGVHGISLAGSNETAQGNHLMAVYMGITLSGTGSMAIDNVVDGFNGDGLRPLGQNNIVRGNLVKNCVATDANHDDGIQSFAGKSGSVKGLVIDSNTIIEWTHTNRSNQLRCSLQGIGLFDGFFDDLTIVNNLVSTSQYHGISVYGARKSVISNNTVVHSEGLTGPYPYIAVRNHKNGSPNSGVLVANNVAMSFTGTANMGTAVEFRNNSVIGTPGAVFENPFALDYRPRATSGFIDTADLASAPAVDILGNPRPSGKGPDRGAYEIIQSVTTAQPTPPQNTSPPKTEGPVVVGPIVSPPAASPPVLIAPVVIPPAVMKPPVAKPIEAKAPPKPMGRLVVRSIGSLMRTVIGRLIGFSF